MQLFYCHGMTVEEKREIKALVSQFSEINSEILNGKEQKQPILNYIQLNHQHAPENCNQAPCKQVHVDWLIHFGKVTNKSRWEKRTKEMDYVKI